MNEDGLLGRNIFIISSFPFWSLAAEAREKSHLPALELYASAAGRGLLFSYRLFCRSTFIDYAIWTLVNKITNINID